MKKRTAATILWGICLFIVSCKPVGHRQAVYDFTPLDFIINGWMNKGYYPGGAICVVKLDSVIFEKNYGDVTADTKRI